eukprot:scaffold1355_cov154-Ochromonas_danica.AAC.5
MDKNIGRLVYRIKGSVSANNYIIFQDLNIIGPVLNFQLSFLQSNVSTIHLEVVTSTGAAMHLTLSTLYDKDSPRFFGRSLRLPLPLLAGWHIFALDLNRVFEQYCQTSNSKQTVKFSFVKGIPPPILDLCEYFQSLRGNKELPSLPTNVGSPVPPPPPSAENSTKDAISALGEQEKRLQSSTSLSINNGGIAESIPSLTPQSLAVSSNVNTIEGYRGEEAKLTMDSLRKQDTPNPAVSVRGGDRLLALEQTLFYRGGPLLLLYGGRMLLTSAGSNLLMIDLEHPHPIPSEGFWRAFSIGRNRHDGGFLSAQCFLKGHAANVTRLEISPDERYLASAEGDIEGGIVILWDLREGRRMSTLRPYSGFISCLNFNPLSSQLVTVGTDSLKRQQLVVWDVALLASSKGVIENGVTRHSSVIAQQTSEYNILNVSCGLGDSVGVITCGKENIRLWRIRKKHLPGRPIILNSFCRGFVFNEICINRLSPVDPIPQHFFVSSNKGLILKVDGSSEQVVCAFQLHSSPITAFKLVGGYAVTGSEDKRLRIWPLDFNDYLLEARHEGSVVSIAASSDGKVMAVGTPVGTLGVLNVSEHSYRTILRSHTATICQIIVRPDGSEIATISDDYTIRVWNMSSGHQSLEFVSEGDCPTCICWKDREAAIICGFSSGMVRILDMVSARSIFECKLHDGEISRVVSFQDGGGRILLGSADKQGVFTVSDTQEELSILLKTKLEGSCGCLPLMDISPSHKFFVLAFDYIESLTIVNTDDWSVFLKWDQISGQANGIFSNSGNSIFGGQQGLSLGVLLSANFIDGLNDMLMLITDKFVLSIPIGNESNGLLPTITRHRVDSPVFVQSDSSGLIVMVVASKGKESSNKANSSIKKTYSNFGISSFQSTQSMKDSDSSRAANRHRFAFLRFRRTAESRDQRAALTSPQYYENSFGMPSCAIASLALGKVIIGDDQGCLNFWKMNKDMLEAASTSGFDETEAPHCVIETSACETPFRQSILNEGHLAEVDSDVVRDILNHEFAENREEQSRKVDDRDEAVVNAERLVVSEACEPPIDMTSKIMSMTPGILARDEVADPLKSVRSSLDQSIVSFFFEDPDENHGIRSTDKKEELDIQDSSDEDGSTDIDRNASLDNKVSSSQLENLVHLECTVHDVAGILSKSSTATSFSKQAYNSMNRWCCPTTYYFNEKLTTHLSIEISRSNEVGVISDGFSVMLVDMSTFKKYSLSFENIYERNRSSEVVLKVMAVTISCDGEQVAAIIQSENITLLSWWHVATQSNVVTELTLPWISERDNSLQLSFVNGSSIVVAVVNREEAHGQVGLHVVVITIQKETSVFCIQSQNVAISCGSSMLLFQPLYGSEAGLIYLLVIGPSAALLLSINQNGMELEVSWKNLLKHPIRYITATCVGTNTQTCWKDLSFFMLDNSGKLHINVASETNASHDSLIIKTAILTLPSFLPVITSQDVESTVLAARCMNQSQFMLALCSGVKARILMLRIEEMGDYSIKAKISLFSKHLLPYAPKFLKLIPVLSKHKSTTVLFSANRQGFISWLDCAKRVSNVRKAYIVSSPAPAEKLRDAYIFRDASILVGLHENSLSVNHLPTGLQTSSALPKMCLCMSLSKDGRWLLVGLANGLLILYETESFQEIDSLDCLGERGKSENIIEEGHAGNSKTVSYLKGAQAAHAAYHRADGVLQVSFRDDFHVEGLRLPFIVLMEGYVFKTGFVHVFQGLDNVVLGRLDHLVQHSMGASHIPTDAQSSWQVISVKQEDFRKPCTLLQSHVVIQAAAKFAFLVFRPTVENATDSTHVLSVADISAKVNSRGLRAKLISDGTYHDIGFCDNYLCLVPANVANLQVIYLELLTKTWNIADACVKTIDLSRFGCSPSLLLCKDASIRLCKAKKSLDNNEQLCFIVHHAVLQTQWFVFL